MRGKTGPGPSGGLDTTSIVLAGYLVAYLVECPHYQVAEQALKMSYCPLRKVAEQTHAMPFAKMRVSEVCPKTKQHFFAPALAAVLADPSLTAQCIDVGMCSRLGVVYLDFGPAGPQTEPWALQTVTRSIFRMSADDVAPPGAYRASHLYPHRLAPLLSMIRGSWTAKPVRARKRQLP